MKKPSKRRKRGTKKVLAVLLILSICFSTMNIEAMAEEELPITQTEQGEGETQPSEDESDLQTGEGESDLQTGEDESGLQTGEDESGQQTGEDESGQQTGEDENGPQAGDGENDSQPDEDENGSQTGKVNPVQMIMRQQKRLTDGTVSRQNRSMKAKILR